MGKYAFKTRTGFIPNKPSKVNQDNYFLIKHFGGIRNNWFFGVCDGHGVNGHFASDHVKKFLPSNIEFIDYMACKGNNEPNTRNNSPNTSSSKPHEQSTDSVEPQSYLLSADQKKKYAILAEGFMKTSFDLRRRSFDVNFSGTTIVSVLVTGNKAVCANVGDSRAILGSLRAKGPSLRERETVAGGSHEGGKVWVAHALSRDHKPDIKDEKDRILQQNGRVDTFREANGDPIGPARVWLKTENIPGLAMSRSLGDLVAQSVGVSPEPEIFEADLTEDDKFIVIASDGVWEFLPNEEIVSLVVPYWLQNNPEGACEKIAKESVAHWKKEDEDIDDITCIVVFLNIQ